MIVRQRFCCAESLCLFWLLHRRRELGGFFHSLGWLNCLLNLFGRRRSGLNSFFDYLFLHDHWRDLRHLQWSTWRIVVVLLSILNCIIDLHIDYFALFIFNLSLKRALFLSILHLLFRGGLVSRSNPSLNLSRGLLSVHRLRVWPVIFLWMFILHRVLHDLFLPLAQLGSQSLTQG